MSLLVPYPTPHSANGSVYLYEIGEKSRCSLGLLPCGPTVAAKKRCLAFSQTTSPMMLAAGCDDGQVVVWQLQGKSWLPLVLPARGKGRVMGVGFAPLHGHTSGLLLTCTEEGGLVMTDLRGATFGARQQPNPTQRRLELNAPVSAPCTTRHTLHPLVSGCVCSALCLVQAGHAIHEHRVVRTFGYHHLKEVMEFAAVVCRWLCWTPSGWPGTRLRSAVPVCRRGRR